jgi:biotin carboxyl carrier protein
MKMEINVVAPAGGRISAINVQPGDSVETDQTLAVIE